MPKKKIEWPVPAFLPIAGDYYWNGEKLVRITGCWQVSVWEFGSGLHFLFLVEDENDETFWIHEVTAGDDKITHPCRWEV